MRGTVVCFGEILYRLGAPERQLLLQTPHLGVCLGGAEANVAVALASLGHTTRMVSALPDNALGSAAVGELRRYGVDVSHVRREPGRMGLYFLTPGASLRPSEILYDRTHSAFARSGGGEHPWSQVFDGADWLHLSGVTLAVGPEAAAGARRAVDAAEAANVRICFDGNFRTKLWALWSSSPAQLLRPLVEKVHLLSASHRDIELMLGIRFEQPTAEGRFFAAAVSAFEAFPKLQRMVGMIRTAKSVDTHILSAIEVSRGETLQQTATHQISSIVDRIGTGDAFAAGVLHGMISGMSSIESMNFALAAACFKHSVPGDFTMLNEQQLITLFSQEGIDVRR